MYKDASSGLGQNPHVAPGNPRFCMMVFSFAHLYLEFS